MPENSGHEDGRRDYGITKEITWCRRTVDWRMEDERITVRDHLRPKNGRQEDGRRENYRRVNLMPKKGGQKEGGCQGDGAAHQKYQQTHSFRIITGVAVTRTLYCITGHDFKCYLL